MKDCGLESSGFFGSFFLVIARRVEGYISNSWKVLPYAVWS